VSTFDVNGQKVLSVDPKALTILSEQAFIDVSHLLRPSHLQVSIFPCGTVVCSGYSYRCFIHLSVPII